MDAESERQLLPNQEPPSKVERDLAPPTANACFDCNICLDFAVEPVVTLCGHLYCWPCIYKWLCQESATAPQCPVCKAALSPATLVPLYGRGCSSEGDKAARGAQDIPRRPPAHAASLRSRRHLSYGHDADFAVSSSSTAAGVLHPSLLSGTAVAVLPWVLGDEWVALYHADPYHLIGSGNRDSDSPRLRRHEMQAKTSLHRMSIFFFFCVVLCLLLF